MRDPVHPTPSNHLLLAAARGERTSRTPVWFMRQAGRFDPAYHALKKRVSVPLEVMFADSDIATEVTLLPKRLGVDGLILFQDILTICGPMGAKFLFRPGPVLERPVRTEASVNALHAFEPAEEMEFVSDSIKKVLRHVDGDVPLLGFAGAPLTVAAFMVAGKSPGAELSDLRTMMRESPNALHRLLSMLAKHTVKYLMMKIQAGVHAVQLFESMADRLTCEETQSWAAPYQRMVLSAIRGQVPTILFAKGATDLEGLVASGANVLSVGGGVDLREARAHLSALEDGSKMALQGNVSNVLMRDGTVDQVEQATRACIREGQHHGHILNLDHGLFPNTPFENVERAIAVARETRLLPVVLKSK